MKQVAAFLHIFIFILPILIFIQCNGSSNQKPLNVDELLVNTKTLAGETVIVEGICTHVCSKSGMKLFLQGNDETLSIRVESDATLGKFNPEATGEKVRVRGRLVEEPTGEPATHHDHEAELTDSTETVHCEEEGAAAPSYHIAATSYQILE